MSIAVGDSQISCCYIRNVSSSCQRSAQRRRQKRNAASINFVYAENRPLEPGVRYRHYILVSTPRPDGEEPYFTASPFSEPWSIPIEDPNNKSISLGMIIPVALGSILAMAILSFFVYRRGKSSRNRKRARPIANPDNHSLSVEPGAYIELEVNQDAIVSRELAPFSLRLSDLFQTMNNKREDDDAQFLQEFKRSIPAAVRQCTLTCDIAQLRVNQPKNRYKNIIPYDRSRVVLSNIPGVEFSDYVNASYMDGYSHPLKFIASQGPKPETIADFWRMMLEQKSRVIAMLTRLVEKRKVKCAQYWPEEQGQPSEYGDISVTLLETVSYGDFVKRSLQISRNNEVVAVNHFQFIAWPDHGIPTTTSSVLRFHKYVMSSQPPEIGPVVVHCSAGVGRTGTFIALDYLSNEIASSNEINIAAIIGKMRTRRPDMVQTLEQYIFIHKLVLELYHYGETDSDVSQFNTVYNELKQNPGGIEQEFAMLEYFEPLDTSQDNGRKDGNTHLNRNPSVLPYDHNAAFVQMIPTDKAVPYYNASMIMSYQPSNKFVAAQSPDENSCDLFWRTVLDNDASMIVALRQEDEPANYCYWPNVSEKATYGPITVRTFDENNDSGYTERNLEVSSKEKKMQVLQIVYNSWSPNSAPSSCGVVLDVIAKVEKHHQMLTNKEQKTTLVHCSDGSARTGTFCAISNLIERLKNENKVDVFRTAKDLRDQRPLMIQTAEQYEFCYQAISEFLQLFDLYGNFQ